MFDLNTVPGGGSLVLIAALYAAIMMFILGPTIGSRVVEKSHFIERCEQALVLATKQDAPDLQTPIPTPDCNSIISIFVGPDGKQLCNIMKPLFQNPLAGQIEVQNQKLIDAHNRRIENSAARATSACSCAINVQLQNRVPWALFSGSFRTVVPSEIKNLDAELFDALSSPVCAGRFQ